MAEGFALPPGDDAADGAPTRIDHGVDYMTDPVTGGLMFYYNYLVYTWVMQNREITARAYLDDISEISLLTLSEAELKSDEFAALRRYVQRRFRVIKTLGADGYQAAYET
jgi:hypothetical protein